MNSFNNLTTFSIYQLLVFIQFLHPRQQIEFRVPALNSFLPFPCVWIYIWLFTVFDGTTFIQSLFPPFVSIATFLRSTVRVFKDE